MAKNETIGSAQTSRNEAQVTTWHRLTKALRVICLIMLSAQFLGASERYVVVLDAGHGGKDPGAVGYKQQEKQITLGIVRKLGQYIKQEHPNVQVLYTRDKDVFVGLQARADFANRHKASVFISVHVNSAPRGSTARGTETYVLGVSKHRNNLSVAMRENKAMLLEDDYKTTYRGFDPSSTESYIIFDLMQNAYLDSSIALANHIEQQYKRIGRSSRGVRQDGFWVLSQSAMPSILTEVGFISNSAEAEYLGSESGQQEMAEAIGRAFTAYYNSGHDQGREASSEAAASTQQTVDITTTPSPSVTASAPKSKAAKGSIYRIQIMSSPNKIDTKHEQFRRLKQSVRRAKEGKHYVYTVGEYRSLAEARKQRKLVAKHYGDCFIVEYRGGARIGRAQ